MNAVANENPSLWAQEGADTEKENPHPQEGEDAQTYPETSKAARLAAARAEMEQYRQEAFHEDDFFKWSAESFCQRHGISYSDASRIVRQTRPTAKPDRFRWLEEVTKACGSGEISPRALVVANILFAHFSDSSPYCWPSQIRIADRAGWKNTRNVRYGLRQLVVLGAVQSIPSRDLPPEIAEKVLAPKDEGGSGRDVRSIAYKRRHPDDWRNGNSGTERSYNNRNKLFRLNHKDNHQQASPDSSPNQRALTFNVESYDAPLIQRNIDEPFHSTSEGYEHAV